MVADQQSSEWVFFTYLHPCVYDFRFIFLHVACMHMLGQMPQTVTFSLQRVLGIARFFEVPEGLENLR